MAWPPRTGELLPRARNAVGIREKLVTYSLDPNHEHGRAKARGFQRILGITLDNIDYLEAEIRTGILTTPISDVRVRVPYGVHCEIRLHIGGLGTKTHREVAVITAWEIAHRGASPRMTTAYPKP